MPTICRHIFYKSKIIMSTKKSFFAHLVEKVDPDKPSGKGTPVNRLPLRGVSAPVETIETDVEVEVLHASAPIGYKTGAGGYAFEALGSAITTLNSYSGTLEIESVTLTPGQTALFQVSDNKVDIEDVILLTKTTGFVSGGAVKQINVEVVGKGSGSFSLAFHNFSTITTYTNETLTLSFAVVKTAVS